MSHKPQLEVLDMPTPSPRTGKQADVGSSLWTHAAEPVFATCSVAELEAVLYRHLAEIRHAAERGGDIVEPFKARLTADMLCVHVK